MVEFGFWEVAGTVVALVIAATISLYVKDWCERRWEYKKLKEKVETIAGIGARVIHDGRMYKIESIESEGLTLKGEIATVFIPIVNVLESEIILPVDNYEEAKIELAKKEMKEMSEVLIPMLRDEMMPALMDSVKEYIVGKLEPGEELDAILGVRVRKALEESGYRVEKVDDEK